MKKAKSSKKIYINKRINQSIAFSALSEFAKRKNIQLGVSNANFNLFCIKRCLVQALLNFKGLKID